MYIGRFRGSITQINLIVFMYATLPWLKPAAGLIRSLVARALGLVVPGMLQLPCRRSKSQLSSLLKHALLSKHLRHCQAVLRAGGDAQQHQQRATHSSQ